MTAAMLLVLGVLTVVGLVLGGLLNVVVIRVPREQLATGVPKCTRTGETLHWWQLLPVLGWLLQRGRARNGKPLHWVFPVVELLTALVLVLLYLRHGFSTTFFYLVAVTCVLVVVAAIDWLHRSIYTLMVLGGALLALAASFVIPYNSFVSSLLGAVAGGIVFLLLFVLAQFLFPAKAAPFGLGDVYLAICLGAALGMPRLPMALLYGILMAGALSAVIVFGKYALKMRHLPEYIAYGTFLCLGALVYIVTQN